MQKNLIIIPVAVLFLLSLTVLSQQNRSSIHFENGQHNLGRISEEEGPFQHDFIFTNKGEDPLIVTSARAGGGVSVVDWTRSPVMPGGTGSVRVEFNPRNMPGRFNRSITLSTTGNPSSYNLRLLGDVIPREMTAEELYPQQIGPLRMRSNHISFGHVAPRTEKTDSMEVINPTGEELRLSFTNIPGHIRLQAVPQLLKPGERGVIKATWDAGSTEDWGIITHHFRLLVNGNSTGRDIIYLSANIQEDFSDMSDEEKENAPVISFEDRVFNFGNLMHGESIEHEFLFTNTGKSELIIRSVRSGCGCTAIEPKKTLLRPGESSSIKAVFNSKGFRGRQNKGITVISNDPRSPNILLRITGDVLSE